MMGGLARRLILSALPCDILGGMMAGLTYRGPDAGGYFHDGPLTLGNCWLSITDIAGSPQPMSAPEGELTCLVNEEIHNLIALRTEAVAPRHVFQTADATRGVRGDSVAHHPAPAGRDKDEGNCC